MTSKTKVKKTKLNKSQLKKYKELLELERDRLLGDIDHLKGDHLNKSHKDNSGELSGYSIHLADMSSDDYDQSIGLGLVSQEQEILYAVDEAIKRIDTGIFGVCEICEKLIPNKRLDAVPYATLCLQCQSDSESKRKVS